MKVSSLARAAVIASAVRPAFGFTASRKALQTLSFSRTTCSFPPMTTRRFLSSTTNTEMPPLKHIGREEMQQVLKSVENGDTNTLVIDVRNVDEIIATGALSPIVKTLPLPVIMQYNVFAMDDDDFEEICKFPKPEPDVTLVFSCAAGVRSIHAANFAAQGGYTNLVNYMGGANEWFSP